MSSRLLTDTEGWTSLGSASDFGEDGGHTVELSGRRVAIGFDGTDWRAVDDACPHQGASLAAGEFREGVVSCPLHAWQFHLETGNCLDHPGQSVGVYEVQERDGELWIEELPAIVTSGCLVRYGALGWVGYFTHELEEELTLGRSVVLKTARGLELGEVLSRTQSDPPEDVAPAGELLREATPEESRHEPAVVAEIEAAEAHVRDQDVPIDIVDGEALLDGETVVLYCLGDLGTETVGIGRTMSEKSGRRVELVPLLDPEPGGCGGGGGGCGLSGCGAGDDDEVSEEQE